MVWHARKSISLAFAMAAAAVLGSIPPGAWAASAADNYPARAVRLIIPYPPAGAGDIIGRILSVKLTETLKQQVVVDNRGGGGQVIATQMTARAAPDGHTVMLASATHAINPGLLKTLPYDTIKDFAPIATVAESPLIFVAHPSLNVAGIQDLIAAAKSRPGKISYASSGPGTGGHLSFEMLKVLAAIDVVHVPYSGAAPALTDVLGGRVPVMCTSPLAALPHVKSGRLRPLGTTGAMRSSAVPGVPTVAEQGVPGFQSTLWYALIAPASTSSAIVERLQNDTLRILKLPDVVEQLASQGAQALGGNRTETARFIQSEVTRWTQLIERAGIQAQ